MLSCYQYVHVHVKEGVYTHVANSFVWESRCCSCVHNVKVNKHCLVFTEVNVKELVDICHEECSITFPMTGSQLVSS